jgi:hypothetical protein
MSWAQKLKRVFNIDLETCQVCGGSAKVIACIEDPFIIGKILNHLQEKSSLDLWVRIHNPRAPSFGEDSRVLGVKKELILRSKPAALDSKRHLIDLYAP